MSNKSLEKRDSRMSNNAVYGTTNAVYGTTNADAGVGIGMLKGDSTI